MIGFLDIFLARNVILGYFSVSCKTRKGGKVRKLILFVGILGILLSSGAYAKELKIGYVDVLMLFNEYDKTKDYESMLEGKKQERAKENKLEVKKEEIIKMQDKLELLKDKELEKQREKIKEAMIKYRTLENKILTELRKESDEKMKEILDDVEKAIKDYSKKNGFGLVLRKSAILYGEGGKDLTDTLLGLLNKQYNKKKK